MTLHEDNGLDVNPRPEGISRKIQKTAIWLYFITFTIHMVVVDGGRGDIGLVLVMWALTAGPAVPYLMGAKWGQKLMAWHSRLMLFFWLLLPMVQHSKDRTVLFWCIWGVYGLLLMAVAFVSSQKPHEENGIGEHSC